LDAELDNPALADIAFLVGEWEMTISNASFLPDPDQSASGRLEVTPIESRWLLVMRQSSDSAGTPLATWVIGRDGAGPNYTVLYADGRGVSRVYEMDLVDARWRIWRDDPEFSQRFEASISVDTRSITGRWEKRIAGGAWEHDFEVSYSRR
jgi:hypothetical protein